VPADLDVHLVIDNYATHKHAAVRAWLAARPHYHAHFTPTDAPWLDQVERWLGPVTRPAIRRASVRMTRELVRRVEALVAADNAAARPFAWTATPESILAKLERLLKAIGGSRHSLVRPRLSDGRGARGGRGTGGCRGAGAVDHAAARRRGVGARPGCGAAPAVTAAGSGGDGPAPARRRARR
jgi:hypothetical protein